MTKWTTFCKIFSLMITSILRMSHPARFNQIEGHLWRRKTIFKRVNLKRYRLLIVKKKRIIRNSMISLISSTRAIHFFLLEIWSFCSFLNPIITRSFLFLSYLSKSEWSFFVIKKWSFCNLKKLVFFYYSQSGSCFIATWKQTCESDRSFPILESVRKWSQIFRLNWTRIWS